MDAIEKSSGKSSSEENEFPVKQHNPNWFDMRQCAILETYYKMGMVGTGKVYNFRHQGAATEVGCTVYKIKVQLIFTVHLQT